MGKRRWIIFSAIFISYWLPFFDRNLTSPALPLIIEDWNLSMAQAGIIATVMLFTYAFGQLPAGYLADRYGRRVLLIMGSGSIAVLNLLLGSAHSFVSFIAVRLVFGLAAAWNLGPSMALVRDWIPMHLRGLAFSFLGFATTLGPLLALFWGRAILADHHWSYIFTYAALPSVLALVLIWTLVRDAKPSDREAVREEEARAAGRPLETAPPAEETGAGASFGWATYKTAFTDYRLWAIYLAWALIVGEFYVVLHFLPTFLVTYHGMELGSAVAVSTSWLWVGLAVSIPGGWLSDRLRSRKWFTCLVSVWASVIVLLLPLFPLKILTPVLGLMGVFWFSTTGAFYAWCSEVSERVSPAIVATVLSTASLFGQLGGAGGTYLAGLLADAYGQGFLMLSAGMAGVLSVVVLFAFLPETFSGRAGVNK
ncbi:MAG: MFS transporter [Firmicutes bacterium]|nr:MFS transporter [Bacillota bacterium]